MKTIPKPAPKKRQRRARIDIPAGTETALREIMKATGYDGDLADFAEEIALDQIALVRAAAASALKVIDTTSAVIEKVGGIVQRFETQHEHRDYIKARILRGEREAVLGEFGEILIGNPSK